MTQTKSLSILIPAQEIMTASDLAQFSTDFHRHFQLRTSYGLEAIRNTRWAVSIEDLDSKFDRSAQEFGGLFIAYGMKDGTFIPILESVIIDTNDTSGYHTVPGRACVIGVHGLVGITDQLRDTLVDEYLDSVRIKRTAEDDFAALDRDTKKGDPRGIHFNEQRIEALLHDNPIVEDRYLVLTALAAEFEINATRLATIRMEYVHTIGLHLARPINIGDSHLVLRDLLNDDPELQGYAMRAADLGNACPPNCIGGKG